MSSRSRTSFPGDAERSRRASRRREGATFTSEKQTQAYLMARDVLRRIQRTSSLIPVTSRQ
jgi:hypothetical protein